MSLARHVCFVHLLLALVAVGVTATAFPSNASKADTLPMLDTSSNASTASGSAEKSTINGCQGAGCGQAPSVFRTVPSTFLLKKFQGTEPHEIDVYQIDPSMFTFAKDGLQFVSQDPDIIEVIAKLEEWDQHPRTMQVKTKVGELQWHMQVHMRKFLRKVLPSNIKAYDVKFRALPVLNGDSTHQNVKPELHKDFNTHSFRVWLPKRSLDGGLIVSPNNEPPFQLFGGAAEAGDAWVFHAAVYHGPAPWSEPVDRGYFGTVSFCDFAEGACFHEAESEDVDAYLSPTLLLA